MVLPQRSEEQVFNHCTRAGGDASYSIEDEPCLEAARCKTVRRALRGAWALIQPTFGSFFCVFAQLSRSVVMRLKTE